MNRKNVFAMRYDMTMNAEAKEAEIMVYDEIVQYKWSPDDDAITAKEFDKLLKDARESGAERLKLRINSPGGSVWQAVAMRSMLIQSGMEIRIDIEGICASAATLLACIPGAHVRIMDGSEYMIHNPSVMVWGTSAELEKQVDRLRRTEEDQHRMYAERCRQSEEQIKEWMDAETWFTASETVQAGFADELIESADMAACVTADAMHIMRETYRAVPESIREKETVSPASTEAASAEAAENNPIKEGAETMEIKEITAEMLRSENAALYEQIMQSGASQERERIQDIDDLTLAGYEEMAKDAKKNGTSAMDFQKAVVRAQREKGQAFLTARAAEVKPAQEVAGGSEQDNDADKDEMKSFEAEIKVLAENVRTDYAGMN